MTIDEMIRDFELRACQKLLAMGDSLNDAIFEHHLFCKIDDAAINRLPVYYNCDCGSDHRLWPKRISRITKHRWKNGEFVKGRPPRKNGWVKLLRSEMIEPTKNEIGLLGTVLAPKKKSKQISYARLEQKFLSFECFHYGFWKKKRLFKHYDFHLVGCENNCFTLVRQDGETLGGFSLDIARDFWKEHGKFGFIPRPDFSFDRPMPQFKFSKKLDFWGGYFPKTKFGGLTCRVQDGPSWNLGRWDCGNWSFDDYITISTENEIRF
jgi:hypothetical protein